MLVLLLAAGVSTALLVAAAAALLRVSGRDAALAARIEAAHGTWTRPRDAARPPPGLSHGIQSALTAIGRGVMRSGVLPGSTRTELQQTLSSAGFRGPNALALFVGAKLAAMSGLPLVAVVACRHLGTQPTTIVIAGILAMIAGMLAPDAVVRRMRLAYLRRLEAGLSDALDLMVICAQAGLSLEPAMARVAAELHGVHPQVCQELATTVRELELMSDSAAALTNLARRTGVESLQRLTYTLIQTMQYGTPLTESLRTLSNEMRTAALTRFEERAARLPVLLTLPMILFILPCVFMIVGGPAAIQIARSLG